MNQDDLTRQEAHFAFGKNWASYAEKVTDAEIKEAEKALSRLLGGARLDGVRFLDIGCGSGLHSLAALRLGAKEVMAVDLDPDSVSTTQAMLTRFAPEGTSFRVEQISVFDLESSALGTFDTVYSWGVLHHTGDMDRAIRCAAAMCAPEGRFIFALYRRVWIDWFWRIEKRWYTNAHAAAQVRVQAIQIALFKLGLLVTGRSFTKYIGSYRSNRGMDFHHDLHDWLGGWPYESILPGEAESLMAECGFSAERVFARKGKLFGRNLGFFGYGCDEFVYKRAA
jgi:2-polyprenyl-3-methyl-5-hydroxy-6-metoxy-1,4-benzoquinol methylase